MLPLSHNILSSHWYIFIDLHCGWLRLEHSKLVTMYYPLGQEQLPCRHETKQCKQDNKLLFLLEHLCCRKRLDLCQGLRQRNEEGRKLLLLHLLHCQRQKREENKAAAVESASSKAAENNEDTT